MLFSPFRARSMSINATRSGLSNRYSTSSLCKKTASQSCPVASKVARDCLSYVQIRHGSGWQINQKPLEKRSPPRNYPMKNRDDVEDVRSRYSPYLKDFLGRTRREDGFAETTPLELEVLRNQTNPKSLGSELWIDSTPLSQQYNHVEFDAQVEMRSQNLSMLDFYEEDSHACSDTAPSHEIVSADEYTANIPKNVYEDLTRNGSLVQINTALLEIGLKNPRTSRQLVFDLYRKLPFPGVSCLKVGTRNRLLTKLSQVGVTEKDERAMMQYLSVFDDLHAAGIKTMPWQWGAAIHFSGRCFKKVTMAELESAMRIWKRMEEEAGIRSNTQTMNILLDIAIKAGQLDIAEMTLAEMRQRNLKFNRVTHLGIIYLHGLRGNGDGVRKAYKDFVLANEVVDTMVLTCVLSALLKAGELSSAMNLYQRMLSRGAAEQNSHEASPQHVWEMGRLLAKFRSGATSGAGTASNLQANVTTGPNIITYLNLIGHHATHTGEITSIVTLLDEMHAAGIPIHGSVFTELFKGFSRHGGKIFTSWTSARLEDVWRAFKKLDDEGNKDVFVGPVIAVAIVEAFRDCSGKYRALQILEEIRLRWRKLDVTHDFDERWLKSVTGLHQEDVGRISN